MPCLHTSIGDVTFQSASYVAGYIQKKINGPMEKTINPKTGLRHYEIMTSDGEIITRQKEYSTMSQTSKFRILSPMASRVHARLERLVPRRKPTSTKNSINNKRCRCNRIYSVKQRKKTRLLYISITMATKRR